MGWLGLLSLGLALEFVGRIFGFRENPFGVWLEILPLFATTGSAVIIIYGAFQLMSAWSARDLAVFRRGLLIILVGGSMLVSSMFSKSIVAQIFG